jgi:hypothetical protein
MAFCAYCGKNISDQAAACPQCGHPQRAALGAQAPKDKTVAVLLAVFLGFWSWLYTYQRDASKFWIGLGGTIAGVVLAVLLFPILAVAGIYVWSIVDAATKPPEFWARYPNG